MSRRSMLCGLNSRSDLAPTSAHAHPLDWRLLIALRFDRGQFLRDPTLRDGKDDEGRQHGDDGQGERLGRSASEKGNAADDSGAVGHGTDAIKPSAPTASSAVRSSALGQYAGACSIP